MQDLCMSWNDWLLLIVYVVSIARPPTLYLKKHIGWNTDDNSFRLSMQDSWPGILSNCCHDQIIILEQ